MRRLLPRSSSRWQILWKTILRVNATARQPGTHTARPVRMHPLLQPRPDTDRLSPRLGSSPARLARSSHRSLTGTVLFERPRTRSGSKFWSWSRPLPLPLFPARLVAVHLTADETTNATLNKCTAGVLILRTWRLHYGPREFSETRWLTWVGRGEKEEGGLMASGYGRYSPLSISSHATSAPFSYALSRREQDIYEALYRIFRSAFRWWNWIEEPLGDISI